MVTEIRPGRGGTGGFLRPVRCGFFIRDYLLGEGPYGTDRIDPDRGAPQMRIFSAYKWAVHRGFAEDLAAREEERRIRRGEPAFTEEEYAARVDRYFREIPRKLVRSRYHSFRRYFHYLKQLGWVEPTGEVGPSFIHDLTGEHPAAQLEKFYRITREGRRATEEQWGNPQYALYPEIAGEPVGDYMAEKRKEKKYRRARKEERFLRPTTVGLFIRDYLMGLGPEGSPRIDPDQGDFTENIFFHYKEMLRRANARDNVAREEERRVQHGEPPFTPEEYTERLEWYLERIPYKLHRARSVSFFSYFHYLKLLGFVEPTGREEEAYIQSLDYADAPPRRWYRLSEKGRQAPEHEWYRPQLTLYPELTPEYFAMKNMERRQQK